MVYFNRTKDCWEGLGVGELVRALHDPRLPEGFDLMLTHDYAGLAIVGYDMEGETFRYLGYIDLFDGEVVLYGEGELHSLSIKDGKNPFWAAAKVVE